MSIQVKLQELKEMHDKGLINAAVYEEQQKALLAGFSSVAATPPPAASPQPAPAFTPISAPPRAAAPPKSEFLDAKKNMSIIAKLAIFFVAVLGGIWLAFILSDKEGKNAISQFASETGIGKQVIPWSDRAEAAAAAIIQQNQQNIADAVQGITHPTGENPSLESFHISKVNGGILSEFRVVWQGGFLGGNYTTVVVWEINENNHVGARVTQDTAMADVQAKNAQALNDYFYTKVYPAFVQGVGN